MLRVAIDVTTAVTQSAGIGRVTRELARALPLLDRETRFTYLYAPEDRSGDIAPGRMPVPGLPEAQTHFPAEATGYGPGGNVTLRRLPLPAQWMTRLWFRAHMPVPVETFTGEIDTYHALDYVAPPLKFARLLVTVHDLSFLAVPHYAEPSLASYLATTAPPVLKRADRVLAVSQFTAREIVERLGVPEERVVVVPNGVDGRFRPLAPGEREAARAAVSGFVGDATRPYLLAVGTVQPRKNYDNLLRAFACLRAAGLPHRLVIAGAKGWQSDSMYEVLQARHLTNDVHIAPSPDALLPALYATADAVVAPAWYEGFGLSVLEGLASGVPVVASDIPPHREIGGSAVHYAPPDDVEALAAAISTTLGEDAIPARDTTRPRSRPCRHDELGQCRSHTPARLSRGAMSGKGRANRHHLVMLTR